MVEYADGRRAADSGGGGVLTTIRRCMRNMAVDLLKYNNRKEKDGEGG